MQVKLLRVLQDQRFTPVGSNREIEVNVRIVAATHRPLEKLVQESTFREDLFYRLNVLPVLLPPLRDRKNDIEVLIRTFIEKFNQIYAKSIQGLSHEAQLKLMEHTWPGNIRELENVIEHAFVIESSSLISVASLPAKFQQAAVEHLDMQDNEEDFVMPETGVVNVGLKLDIQKLDFQASKEAFEREFLIAALRSFRGRINQTAIHANIPKKTLLRKLEKYGISAKDYA
jgi:two-component system response regulator HydG